MNLITPLKGKKNIIPNWLFNKINYYRYQSKSLRKLEIGPGGSRLPGFETLNVLAGPNTDFVYDAGKSLPFKTGTFDMIYASHVLEHMPWYQTEQIIAEWVRVLKINGTIEIWVPDGLKIARAFVESETAHATSWLDDGWFRYNEDRDSCKWACGRIFSYGDGTGSPGHPNWHRSIFSPRYLALVLEKAGLKQVRQLEGKEVRGYDHGWINLGMIGTKL